MVQGRSAKIIAMIKWSLSIKNFLSELDASCAEIQYVGSYGLLDQAVLRAEYTLTKGEMVMADPDMDTYAPFLIDRPK